MKMKTPGFPFFGLLLALILIIPLKGLPLSAQQTLSHEVRVILNLIQVHVFDKGGNPAEGLTKDDFILFDNGKQVEITEFETHRILQPSETEPIPEAPQTAPAEKMDSGRRFILIFDFAYNSSRGILDSKTAAVHFIENNILPGDKISLLSYSSIKGLTIHEYFIQDRAKIQEVINGFGIKNVLGRAEDVEQKFWSMMEDEENQGDAFDMASTDITFNRFISKQQAKHFIQSVDNLSGALQYVSGKKNILLFSSGIPGSLIQGKANNFRHGFDKDLYDAHKKMIRHLASANCSIYAISSTKGLTDWDFDMGFKDIAVTGLPSLKELTHATGGRFFGNIKDYEKIMEDIQIQTGTYYVLGYYLSRETDGKYHDIKVKLKNKGYKVFSQQGYFNPKPFNKYSKLEKKLHFLDIALNEKPASDIDFFLPLQILDYRYNGDNIVTGIVKLPLAYRNSFDGKNTEIVHLLLDEANNIIDIKGGKMRLSQFPQEDIYCTTTVNLSSGYRKWRAIFRNLDTGKTGRATGEIIIPDAMDKDTALNSPLIIVEGEGKFFLKGTFIKESRLPTELTDIYPFDANRFHPVIGPITRPIKRIYLIFPDFPIESNRIYVSFYDNGTGKMISKTRTAAQLIPEKKAVFMEVLVHTLDPGSYILKVMIEDENGIPVAVTSTPLEIQ